MYKAILLDFYGTLVAEDGRVVSAILSQIVEASPLSPSKLEVAGYWTKRFSDLCAAANGVRFKGQREIEVESLKQVLAMYEAPLNADELASELFAYWVSPTPLPGSCP